MSRIQAKEELRWVRRRHGIARSDAKSRMLFKVIRGSHQGSYYDDVMRGRPQRIPLRDVNVLDLSFGFAHLLCGFISGLP